jgi:DNA-binding transcriptional regulator LsrR (DeoR family)
MMGKPFSFHGDEIQSPIPAISLKRQARIKEIQDKYDSGLKVREIAEYFGISKRSIFKDLKAAKDLNRVLMESIDQREVLGREIRFLRQLGREAMRR